MKQDFLDPKVERLAIAGAIQRHLDSKGLARKVLVRDYLSKSTVEKVFQGEFSDRTLTKIEGILKTTFSKSNGAAVSADDEKRAPATLGGYRFDSVSELVGTYLCIRYMFNTTGHLNCYLLQIEWDESQSCLTFAERSRRDNQYSQKGKVYIPFGIPFMNLVSTDRGSLRNVLVSLPDHAGVCRGVITTLSNPKGPIYIPASAPVVMRLTASGEQPEIGYITQKSKAYEAYVQDLVTVVREDYGLFVLPQEK